MTTREGRVTEPAADNLLAGLGTVLMDRQQCHHDRLAQNLGIPSSVAARSDAIQARGSTTGARTFRGIRHTAYPLHSSGPNML